MLRLQSAAAAAMRRMMEEVPEILHPERALAVAYAPRSARAGLATLFGLDERLERIALRTAEPTLALIRLTWWRDSLAGLGSGPRPADPLLRAAAKLAPAGIDSAALAGLADGWEALIDDPDWSAGAIATFAQARGAGLFRLAGRLLGAREAEDARIAAGGEAWARADLARIADQPDRATRVWEAAGAAPSGGWRRPLRPLGMLAALAERDRGDAPAFQPLASRGRLARIMLHQLTGR